MRLGILTAAWRRARVTAAVLGYYAGLSVPGLDVVRVCAVSPGGETPRVEGWHYVQAPNEPLSGKWNAGMAHMQAMDVDAVMIVGSDDLVSTGYITDALSMLGGRRPAGIVLFDTVHFYEVTTGACYRACPQRLGAGRVLSAELLRRLDWQPWPADMNRRLDGGMDSRLRPALAMRPRLRTATLRATPGRIIIDLKTPENMWSFESMRPYKTADVDGPALLARHFPGPAEALAPGVDALAA